MNRMLTGVIERSRVERNGLLLAAAFTAASVIAGHGVRLPFTEVPVTLQTFVAVLAGMTLGRKLGALSQIQYLIIGLAGAPVFANPPFGGPAYFASPSFGYLPGLVLAAYASGWAWEKLGRKGLKSAAVSAALGASVIYLIGVPYLACWLMVTTGKSAATCATLAWMKGLLPFIGPDALKVSAVAVIAAGKR